MKPLWTVSASVKLTARKSAPRSWLQLQPYAAPRVKFERCLTTDWSTSFPHQDPIAETRSSHMFTPQNRAMRGCISVSPRRGAAPKSVMLRAYLVLLAAAQKAYTAGNLKRLPARHRKFRANRSMRDVEPEVNLWLRTIDGVEIEEEETE